MIAHNFGTVTMEQAVRVWQMTEGFRRRVLKEESYMDPQAWRSWLDNEIETLAKCAEPTENTVGQVKQYIGYWMAVDTLIKHKESEDLRHKQNMAALLADFRGMKNAK